MIFNDVWKLIQAKLAIGVSIPNWTLNHGQIEGAFTIAEIAEDSIHAFVPTARNLQKIPKVDFEEVFAMWPGYTSGRIARNEIRDKTRFSKYIISIFHWIEL